MKWQDAPQTVERLAAAYALGTLAGPARRRFEAVMATHRGARRAVDDWNRRLQPLATRLEPLPAGDALWSKIEQRAFGAKGAGAATPAKPPWWRRVSAALWSPVPAGALAMGLAVGMLLPSLWPALTGDTGGTELPESYVGVLATAEARTGMIVSSRRYGTVAEFKRVAAVPVPPGQTLFLWAIDVKGTPTPVGPVPSGAFVRVKLAAPAERLFASAVELGLTTETTGSAPQAPSGAYAYRGLCGKLWRVPAPP